MGKKVHPPSLFELADTLLEAETGSQKSLLSKEEKEVKRPPKTSILTCEQHSNCSHPLTIFKHRHAFSSLGSEFVLFAISPLLRKQQHQIAKLRRPPKNVMQSAFVASKFFECFRKYGRRGNEKGKLPIDCLLSTCKILS